MSKRQFVVRAGNNWGVRGAGNSKLTCVTKTQGEAIQAGRSIAQNHKTELVIQGRDGRFREAYSYGNDPFPPKG